MQKEYTEKCRAHTKKKQRRLKRIASSEYNLNRAHLVAKYIVYKVLYVKEINNNRRKK